MIGFKLAEEGVEEETEEEEITIEDIWGEDDE